MPRYEILCLLPNVLEREAVAKKMLEVGKVVLGSQGVITDLRNYGNQVYLGHEVRNQGAGYTQVRGEGGPVWDGGFGACGGPWGLSVRVSYEILPFL